VIGKDSQPFSDLTFTVSSCLTGLGINRLDHCEKDEEVGFLVNGDFVRTWVKSKY
jgi:hypothetical protein